jgi:hypothetical protein
MPPIQIEPAGQNWVITPAALAVNESRPSNISHQKWLVVLSGVFMITNLKGDNPSAWRRETLQIRPDIDAPLESAVHRYSIPVPKTPAGDDGVPVLSLDQWAPFAAISSIWGDDTSDAGYAVDLWRPSHFEPTADTAGNPLTNVFSGIDVDVAVRNDRAILYRVSCHITLLGKIVFTSPME